MSSSISLKDIHCYDSYKIAIADILPKYEQVYSNKKRGPKSLPTAEEIDSILNNVKSPTTLSKFAYNAPKGCPQKKYIKHLHVHRLFHNDVNIPISTPCIESPWYGDREVVFKADWVEEFVVNNWTQFEYKVVEGLLACASKYIHIITNYIMEIIHKEGYFNIRSDEELTNEYYLRRNQYPNQKLYCFLGYQMYDYIKEMYKEKHLDADYIQVRYTIPYNTPELKCNHGGASCHPWASAIIAEKQIRLNSKYTFNWAKTRRNRCWIINCKSDLLFRAEIDKRKEEKKVIVKGNRRAHNIILD